MAGVSVKIGANTSEFQRAMKEMAQSLKVNESELNLASQKAKMFGTSTDYLKSQITALTSKLQAQNNMMKTQKEYVSALKSEMTSLKEKQNEINSSLQNLNNKRKEAVKEEGEESKKVKDLDKEIKDLNTQYEQNASALNKLDSRLANANMKLNKTESNTLKTKESLSKMNMELKTSKVDSFGKSMGNVSEKAGALAGALTPASLAIAGAGAYSAHASLQFSDSLAKLSTIADTSKVSMGQFKDGLLDLSNEFGISVDDLTNDTYSAISASVDTGDAMDFVAKSTKLATAGFAESGQAIDVLTTIMNAYGMKENDVNRISNDLIRTQNLGKTTVGQLSQYMGMSIPIAHETGTSLEQVCSAYVMMTRRGVDTAESTTEIKSLLEELGKSGSKSAGILKEKTGKSFSELMASGMSLGDVLKILKDEADKNHIGLNELFTNVRSGTGALELASTTGETFNQVLQEMSVQGNDTDEAYNKIAQTAGFKLKKALNELRNSSIKLGDSLQPLISRMATGISDIATAFSKLSPWQVKLITDLALAVVGFAGFVKGVSIATGTLKTFSSGLSQTIKFFAKNDEGVSNFTKVLGGAKKSVGGFKTALVGIKSGLGLFRTGLTAVWSVMLANPLVLVVAGIALLAVGLYEAYKHCATFRNAVNTTWKDIKLVFTSFGTFFKSVFTIAKQVLTSFLNTIKSVFNTIKKMVNTVKNVFTQFVNIEKQGLNKIITSIASWGQKIKVRVKAIFKDIWNIIKVACLGGLLLLLDLVTFNFTKLKSDALAIWRNLSASIGNIVKNLGQIVLITFNSLKSGVSSAITGIKTRAIQIFNAIKYKILDIVQNMKQSLVNSFNSMKNTAINTINNLKNGIVNAFHSIINFFLTLPSRLRSIGSQMFTSMRSGISGAIGGVRSAIVSGIQSALSYLASLPSKAFSYGSDFIHGMVSGIESSISSVVSAVSNVANTIRSYLHFSVPDTGSLRDYETWMPDFMQGLAIGINNNKHLVKNAVADLAGDIKLGATVDLKDTNLKLQNATVTHVLRNYEKKEKDNNKLIQVNLQVSSKTIATTIVDELGTVLAKKQRARGVSRGVLSYI